MNAQRAIAPRLPSWCLAGLTLSLLGLLASSATALPRPGGGPPRPGLPSVRGGLMPPRFTHPPYLQDVSESGLVIVWSTDVVTTGTVRLLGPEEPSSPTNNPPQDLEPAEQPQPAVAQSIFVSPAGQQHRVRLAGLRTGTRYRYSIGVRRLGDVNGLETTSPLAEFSTAPQRGPFVFLVYGDNRDRDGDHAAVVQAMLPEHADFILQTGDMVSRASDEHQWRRYFTTANPILRTAPIYPVLGNHELRGDPEAHHFHRLFLLPSGSQGRRRRPVYYSFRYSNSVFVAIDGNSPYDYEQTQWLERTLAAAQADTSIRHIFAFVHQPPYAVGAYCGSERLQRRIVPILARYHVRAVFAGHEHAYQHLERAGLRYFISGGGGAPLYFRSQACTFEDDMALRLFRAEHHYLRVQVDGDAVSLTAIDKRGGVMERVPLHEPVTEPPSPPPPLFEDEDRPRVHPAPLLALSSSAPQPTSASRRSAGPLLLLWLSSLSILAGLLMLTRSLRPRRR